MRQYSHSVLTAIVPRKPGLAACPLNCPSFIPELPILWAALRPFSMLSMLNKGGIEVKFFLWPDAPLSPTSRNHSLDLIFSLTTMTPEQGKGRHSFCIGSPTLVPQVRVGYTKMAILTDVAAYLLQLRQHRLISQIFVPTRILAAVDAVTVGILLTPRCGL